MVGCLLGATRFLGLAVFLLRLEVCCEGLPFEFLLLGLACARFLAEVCTSVLLPFSESSVLPVELSSSTSVEVSSFNSFESVVEFFGVLVIDLLLHYDWAQWRFLTIVNIPKPT